MKVNIVKPMESVMQLPHFIVIEAAHVDWLNNDEINDIIGVITGCNPETEYSWRYVVINTYSQKVDYCDRFSTKPMTFLTAGKFFDLYYGKWKQAFDNLSFNLGNVFE